MIAIASCWPPEVAAGSGTTVSQNRLRDAANLAGLETDIVYTSFFGTDASGLEQRQADNRPEAFASKVAGHDAVLGIDGEGWQWGSTQRRQPYVAFCEAVLAEVLPFESGAIRDVLTRQAEWESAAAHVADATVARSNFSKGKLVEHYGVQPDKVTVLPIPFDVDTWRASLPAVEKGPLVLAVGHLYPRKNYRSLLEAWPAVRAAHPQARLALVGIGPEHDALARLAAATTGARLVGHVSFEELRALYARAHVFCHPSLQENFGISIVEGLASDCAVVTHTQGAVMESTAGLPGTYAVNAAQPAALADALIAALASAIPPTNRLDSLTARLHPAAVGATLTAILAGVAR